MRRIVAAVVTAVALWAGPVDTAYDVSFGIFDKLGRATAVYRAEGSRYTMTIGAKATGTAAFLSGGREDRYESTGTIVGGRYRPDRYVTTSRSSGGQKRTVYLFDHDERQIRQTKEEAINGRFVATSTQTIPYYAPDDILTLYFSVLDRIETLRTGMRYSFYAVGANKKDGRVDVTVADGAAQEELRRDLGYAPGDRYLIVVINQKIFSSANGELALRIASDGTCTRAVLKDVLFFGDIRGEIVR